MEALPLQVDRASHTATLLDDGRVLIAGGGSTAGSLVGGDALVYDPQMNNWTPTEPMILPVAQAAASKLLDGRVLVAGGFPPSENPQISAQVQIYDPASNTWTSAASLSQPRVAHILELPPDDQVLAIGGAREYDYPYSRPWTEASFVRLIERYDPIADRWSIAGELPQPLAYAALAWLPDGRLWLTGGNAARGAWADTWLISPLPGYP
jgi:N-acetylneuraminic acid mutarotase